MARLGACVLTKHGTGFLWWRIEPYANRWRVELDGHPGDLYDLAEDEFEVLS